MLDISRRISVIKAGNDNFIPFTDKYYVGIFFLKPEGCFHRTDGIYTFRTVIHNKAGSREGSENINDNGYACCLLCTFRKL